MIAAGYLGIVAGPSWSQIDKAALERDHHRVRTVRRAELREDALDVVFNGVLGNA
jgi:hypothetical protein